MTEIVGNSFEILGNLCFLKRKISKKFLFKDKAGVLTGSLYHMLVGEVRNAFQTSGELYH